MCKGRTTKTIVVAIHRLQRVQTEKMVQKHKILIKIKLFQVFHLFSRLPLFAKKTQSLWLYGYIYFFFKNLFCNLYKSDLSIEKLSLFS